MDRLIEILISENLTCVVEQNGVLYREKHNGIIPMLNFVDKGVLKHARVADKVIGKAAAMMMVFGGVKEVSTDVISEYAYAYFMDHHIPVTYKHKVPYIINRTKDGMCPMEECVMSIQDPAEAYDALRKKVALLKATR